MTKNAQSPYTVKSIVRHIDPAIATAFACIVALLLVGSIYSSSFLSPEYLLQQLKDAACANTAGSALSAGLRLCKVHEEAG